MKTLVQNHLIEFTKLHSINTSKIEILSNKDYKYGQYSTNLLFEFESNKRNDLFQLLKDFFSTKYNEIYEVEKLEIKEPGFLNIFFKNSFLVKSVLLFVDPKYKPEFSQKKLKINYEFVSANPTGYLHIGHARNAIVGDINCRVLEYIGHDVTREYYINDAGNQINDLYESVKWYYLNGVDAIAPEDIPYKGKEIKKCAADFKEKNPNYIFENKENILTAKNWFTNYFLDEIKNILQKINIKPFKIFTSEKYLYTSKLVDSVFEKLKLSGKIFEEEGASWLKTTDFGDDKDRVLKKSDGSFTYVNADIANHWQKFQGAYDKIMNLWGADHKGYELRIIAGVQALGLDSNKIQFDFINMVNIFDNNGVIKMSKRKGTSFTISEMLEQLEFNLLRYFIVSKNKEQGHEISISQNKTKNMSNPYYYAQYAYARICQIISNKAVSVNTTKNFSKLGLEVKENYLMSKILELADHINYEEKTQEPYVLIKYLKDLSNYFHSYYNNVVVISNDEELTEQRMHLMFALKNVYEIVYSLLGIEPLEKM